MKYIAGEDLTEGRYSIIFDDTDKEYYTLLTQFDKETGFIKEISVNQFAKNKIKINNDRLKKNLVFCFYRASVLNDMDYAINLSFELPGNLYAIKYRYNDMNDLTSILCEEEFFFIKNSPFFQIDFAYLIKEKVKL